jgi:hypothetical protein
MKEQNVLMTPMTVVVPASIKATCERRARAERRPLSSYLRNIIQDAVCDHGQAREEDRGQ